jgi:phosphoribosyl-ATP pyrophosphohydrolase
LARAQKLQDKASKVGFDWNDPMAVLAKIREEIGEVEEALAAGKTEDAADEAGDLMFAMVNLELTRIHVFDRPAVVGVDGLPKNARLFAWGALLTWGFAMVAGRLTAYPNFVEAWLGF